MRRALRLYTAFQLFFGLLLWVPVFYEVQRRLGLSDAQIFSIQSWYYVAFCLLEIPTGVLADRWGRRRCLRLGALALVAANLVPIAAPSYAGFLGHFLLIAAARSLISGASSAYLYDYLQRAGDADAYERAEGAARAWSLVAKVACWAAVGPLMRWDPMLPYWLTAASGVAALGFAARLPALPGARDPRGAGADGPPAAPATATSLPRVARLLVGSPMLVLLMLQGIAIFVLARICQVNLFQPILGAKAFGVEAYGAVMAAMTVFEAIGSARPGWLRRRMSDLGALFALTVAMAASLASIVGAGRVGTVAWLCVFSLATGLSFPIQRQLLNDAIPDSRYRATLLSIESIVDRAVCALVALALGGALSRGALGAFLYQSAAVTVGSVALLWGLLQLGRRRGLALSAAR